MSMPHPDATVWTAEMVRALQDESHPAPRYELVDGELLVTPSPQPLHQFALFALARVLHDHVRAHGLGIVLLSPADLELEPGTVVQPDLFVVPADVARPLRSWREVRALLLAVEVVSPSSVRADRLEKRRLYQRAGVPEYWVVDVDARLIERWRPADDRPELLDERLTWAPPGAVPLELDLAALFAEVHGE
jgi:Uma2 family endonuclease